jgi:hypothetical protein
MGVSPKRGLPIAVAQHGDGLSPRCVIRRLQRTSQRDSNAQRFKEISGAQFTVHDSRWSIPGEVELGHTTKGRRFQKNVFRELNSRNIGYENEQP